MTKAFGARRRQVCLLAGLSVGAAGTIACPAHASEGGASFYLLGSGGPGAGILPPIEGVFFDNTIFYYDGKAAANRQFVVGGNLVAGLDVTIIADFASVLWIPSTNVLGGTLAVGAALAAGRPDANVEAVLTGPRGRQVTISREDKATIIGDPVLTAALGWNLGRNIHVAASTTVNVPIGHYREGELANLSFHRWIVDTSFGISLHDPKAGWDMSAKAGFTFNGKNDFTDYESGNDFHLEAAVEKTFSPSFSAGLQGYYYNQITGDSGEGATLGPNEGKVIGLGATAAYNFRIGRAPVTARFRFFEEFEVERRLDGTAAFFSLTLPLSVKLPPGHAR